MSRITAAMAVGFVAISTLVLALGISNIASHPAASPEPSSQQIAVTTDTPVATAEPTATPTPPPQQTAFDCTGDAPNGINISYGSDSSTNDGGVLPFHAVRSLDATAKWYYVTAQLSGGGSVDCTTTISWNDTFDHPKTVSKHGSASGGYSIARAQICQGYSYDAAWIAC